MDLSDPFLGRCNFHHIAFPRSDMMRLIVMFHFPKLDEELVDVCIGTFYRLRKTAGD